MLAPGTVLGDRYEIIEKIGAGGMSIVYKAKCNRLQRFVAIKVLREEFAQDEAFLKKFRTEALASASLSHPNIVGIYDVGNDHDLHLHYIVMELVEGKTLKELIKETGPLPTKQVLEYGIQILSALRHAHRKQIIHRDIKPQNILVTSENVLKVADFGIARAVDSSTIVATGNAIGSVHYFSPEQAKGKYINETSDLYSCGIVLFELLTNKLPFEAESHVSIALKHINEEIPRPSTFIPDVPIGLEGIILKATDKRQEMRYQTAEDMIADLKHVMENPNYIVGRPDFEETADQTILLTEKETEILRGAGPKDTVSEKYSYEELDEEDEEDDEEVSFGYKVLVGAAGVLGTLILMSLLALFIFFKLPEFNTPDYVPVPNVKGQTVEKATEILNEKELKLVVKGEQENDNYEPGTIIKQSPEKEKPVEPGTIVEVLVAKEVRVEEVVVPDVIGIDSAKAQGLLNQESLEIKKINKEYSDEVEAGKVIDQDPRPGMTVEAGTLVTLTVSDGPEIVYSIVPDLRNLIQDEAKKRLKDAGLELGNITEEYSNDVESGRVISQSNSPDSQMKQGESVDIVISLGAEETENPGGTDPNPDGEQSGEVTKTYILQAPKDNSKASYHVLIIYEGALGNEPITKTVFDSIVEQSQFPMPIEITASGQGKLKVFFDSVPEYEDPIEFNEVTQ